MPANPETAMPAPTQPAGPIALQLWTIREAVEADLDAALGSVRAAGFAAVELAPLPPGVAPGAMAEALDRHGLTVASIHGDLLDAGNVAAWAALGEACRCPRVIWHGWPRDPRFDSRAGVDDLLAACNRAAQLAADHGLTLGMHNHWWEFEPVDGVAPLRLFRDRLEPAIFWQLDVYWARVAGEDPAAVVGELGPRLGSIHWKDGPAVPGEPMTAPGTGVLDLPAIAGALGHPVGWVIELDECATDRLDAARRGLAYLETLR